MLAACQSSGEYNSNNNSNKDLLIGHIRIEEHTLYLDEIEWITEEDEDRIKELHLSQQADMPNGYYIHNPTTEIASYQLNDQTVYHFIDWGNDFVGENENRNHTTNSLEEFNRYLNTYSDKGAKLLFWVETQGDEVLSVNEQFIN